MSLWDRLYGPLLGALTTLLVIGAVLLSMRMRDMNPPLEIVLPTHTPTVPFQVIPTVTGTLININTASVALLETLPGIGEVRARRIVDHRNQNGPFRSSQELVEQKLIPLSVYEQIKGRLTVD